MSAEYPDRARWLNIRRKVHTEDTRKLMFQSVFFGFVKNATGTQSLRKLKAESFDGSRNAQKRVARAVPALRAPMLRDRRARRARQRGEVRV